MAIGGPARYFVVVKTEAELAAAIQTAKKFKLPWFIVGEGSNLIADDRGYKGVVIKCQISNLKRQNDKIIIGAGYSLLNFIYKANKWGLAGLERMAGRPGTVGGAIYGCAGAYGQEIKDRLVSVRFYNCKQFKTISAAECRFGYRTSIFKKHKEWVITEAEFKLAKGKAGQLSKISRDIIKLRAVKYKPGLKCPGSFFKNLKLADMSEKAAARLTVQTEDSAIKFGKLPSGYLLERVGAKGMREGGVAVAKHHANLIYNTGRGTALDVKKLSTRLKGLVKKKFGIIIDEEVQYL